jgi:exopolysaccharide biosynthesis protein
MSIRLRVSGFGVCLLASLALLAPAQASAAQLQGITLDVQPYYVDVRLSFDTRPQYTDSYRYDPDRYLLTFTGCTSTVSEEQATALAQTGNTLVTRVSVYPGADNIAVGFYVNQRLEPFIRYDDTSYTVRFYTAVQHERTTQLSQGVALVEKYSVYQGKNYHAYILKVDASAPVDIFAAAADRYDGKTRRRAPSSFARRENAIAVVNGGFFSQAGEHLSTLIEDGVLRASGVYPARPALVFTQEGQRAIGRYNVETALIANGTRIPVNGMNGPYQSGKVFAYNYKYPVESLPQSGMYYYLLEGGRLRYFNTTAAGLALAPEMLLVATDIMPEANPLRQIPDGAEVSVETRITDTAGQAVSARSAIGGAPMLVENGALNITNEQDKVQDDIAKSERSRTAAGLTRDGQLIIAVVKELESAGYGGVTLPVLAQLMIDEGAWTALNLDGGGSSALVVAGDLLNITAAEERPVSNVLVIKPGAAPSASPADNATPAPARLKYERRGNT